MSSDSKISNNICIRAMEPSDIEDIIELGSQPGALTGTLRLPFTSRAQSRRQLEQLPDGGTFIVAEKDARVVAMATLSRGNRQRAHLASLGIGVHDRFQGQGIGSALMAALIDLADNWLNLKRLELTVDTDNEPALRLYQKFGFAIEGTCRAVAYRQGRFVDAFMMARIRE